MAKDGSIADAVVSPTTVVVADDDEHTRFALERVLSKQGYGVELVADGRAAMEAMLRQGGPRIAILDWYMPDIDGVEVCRLLRAKPPTIRPYLIVLTGRKEKAQLTVALDSGADDYVVKPFDHSELVARVGVAQRAVATLAQLHEQSLSLRRALDEVQTLRALLPICSYCKKIRDEEGSWQDVESYVHQHTGSEFSHGICPTCLDKHFPP